MKAGRFSQVILAVLFLLGPAPPWAAPDSAETPAVASLARAAGLASGQALGLSPLPEAAGQTVAASTRVASSASCATLATAPTPTPTALPTPSPDYRVYLPTVRRNADSQPASGLGQVLPPSTRPAAVAAPLDGTAASDFAAATAFIYAGSSPRQTGVVTGTIDPQRAAVLRGQVCTRQGAAMADVQISVLGHPEYGSALSGADGTFDIAANGGGLLTVSYAKSGYLPAQRQVNAPWQDYAWLPDVVLIPLDSQVTTIDLAASDPLQVARGSAVADADGARQATLLVPQGTTAELVLADGTKQPLTRLSVRATEYTVGESGRAAMPAELPPSSGYTYALEYSVDEGLAAGAVSVRFNRPVYHYVENFLGFPVGTIVPVGFYDKQQATWVASENGRVVKILSVTNGLANLDTDGDGAADSGSSLGVVDAERQRLATLYQSGQSLWRVPLTHFSPVDCNWPYGPADGAKAPDQQPTGNDPLPDPDCQSGSIVECQNQILGEAVDVVGTPFRLHYQSERVPGRLAAYTLDIPLTGITVPASLRAVELDVRIAGRRFYQRIPVAPGQGLRFTWDGKDAYGRDVKGRQRVTVLLGYVYDAIYMEPAAQERAFGALSGVPITIRHNGGPIQAAATASLRLDSAITLWRTWLGMLGNLDSRAQGLGGWSLSVHHVYDPAGKVLYLGDGRRQSSESWSSGVINTVAGGGFVSGVAIGDGGPAKRAELAVPAGLAVAADGSLYIAEGVGQRVRRVGPTGIITTVVGTGASGYSGDGGPATQAQINNPSGIALGPDGSLYIADRANQRVRRVGPDGIISTVAGTGVYGYSGDGGPAAAAKLNGPYGVAVAPDGSLYIADTDNYRIRRVAPDGTINTVAGGTYGFGGDGGPAIQAALARPQRIALAPDGSLYIADTSNLRVRRVGTDGIINSVAGIGTSGSTGDGGAATLAELALPVDVAVAPDGSLYIADRTNYRVRWVGTDGVIRTVAGSSKYGFSGDGGLATRAKLEEPTSVAVGPDGSFYLSDWFNQRVRRVIPMALPGASTSDIVIPAADGREVYVFDGAGRHLRTLDGLSGTVLYQFTYDSAARLTAVQDANGNVTSVERGVAGEPTAIVGPYGQRTTLALNADGYLARIANPAGEFFQLSSTAGGLLSSLTDPRGNLHSFSYDSLGRLIRDANPAGGALDLSRLDGARTYTVTLTTALSRTTSYQVQQLPTAERRVDTLPTGLQTELVKYADGTHAWRFADGVSLTQALDPDPRWGLLAPLAGIISITSPGGPAFGLQLASTAVLTDANNPLSASSLTNVVSVNGRPYTSTYTAGSRTLLDSTPSGRRLTTSLDEQGRVVREQVADLLPTRYGYDSRGRLITATVGTDAEARQLGFAYDSAGRLASVTDPLSRTLSYAYDAAGRLTTQTLPDGRATGFGYDANGNVTALTPPGRPAHGLAYAPVDLPAAYSAPDVGAGANQTVYTYDADRQLTRLTRADGQTVALGYDGAGRLSSLTLPGGQLHFTYETATGHVATIAAPGGISLAYQYDGRLATRESWAGAVAGSLSRTYDGDFRVATLSVNGSDLIAFQRDRDGLLVQAGALALSRNVQNGLLMATALASITDTWAYNGFVEPLGYRAAASGSPLYDVRYSRDRLGRITVLTETIGGATSSYGYSYDLGGRLVEVRQNGAASASYTYDANGNRLTFTGPAGTVSGSYDAQDRLTQYGSSTYAYTADGELLSKTAGGQTTVYQYDALGNLLAATLPNGTPITYLVDGQNRRVGKRISGTLVQGFLYQDSLRPIAELDGGNTVVSRFVYAGRSNLPAYLIKGGVTYRLVADHLGSPRLVANAATGEVVQRMDYDAFGQVITDTNPGFQPFGFAGGLYDRDTKLVHFDARDYDAEIGRWTAKDPALFAGGFANLYVYVGNDPLNWRDPSGLQACDAGTPDGGVPVASTPDAGPAQSQSWRRMASMAQDAGFTVTGRNETAGHNTGSPHYRGRAIDVRTRDQTDAGVDDFIARMSDAGFRVRDERTRPAGQAVWQGPHVHVECPTNSPEAVCR